MKFLFSENDTIKTMFHAIAGEFRQQRSTESVEYDVKENGKVNCNTLIFLMKTKLFFVQFECTSICNASAGKIFH